MTTRNNYFIGMFVAISLLSGCKSSMTGPSTSIQGISMSHSGLYPSRAEESYGLWFEFPKGAPGRKGEQIQHGVTVDRLASTFRILPNGSLFGFDTVGLASKLGYPLAIAIHASISIEKTDSIGATPRTEFLVGEITGTSSTGTATLTSTHEEALNYDFTGMSASVTLANVQGKPPSDLELYLMNATSSTQTSPSVNSMPLLPDAWEYAMWAVDSSTKSLPPFNIYYGTFTSPAEMDSKPGDNHYPYPGGRFPADSTQPIYDLRSNGKIEVMLTLEPKTNGARPSSPFGAILLKAAIPSSIPPFSPIQLSNKAALFPTASITIHR